MRTGATIDRQIHRRYATADSYTSEASPTTRRRRRYNTGHWRGDVGRHGRSEFALAHARPVSVKKYKSQTGQWLSSPDTTEPDFGLVASYREHRSEPDYKEKLLASLRSHIGNWVAIRGSEVLVSGNSARDVIGLLRERKLRADSLFRVPQDAKQENIGER